MWALDFSPSAFEQLASLDVGLLQGMTVRVSLFPRLFQASADSLFQWEFV